VDTDRFDHIARTLGRRRPRRALGLLPMLGIGQKLGLLPPTVEVAAAGNQKKDRHKGEVKCGGGWIPRCRGGTLVRETCGCLCPSGQAFAYHCSPPQCIQGGSCCPNEKRCGNNCIPRNECCNDTERTCHKIVKKKGKTKGKKKGTKFVDYCVVKPACCPEELACPASPVGCCKTLTGELCTTVDGCCNVLEGKEVCDGKWCCRPEEKCCPGEGCVAKTGCCATGGSSCATDPKKCCEDGEKCCPGGCKPAADTCCPTGEASCGGLVCCAAGETCTTGTYLGMPRANCCTPNPGALGPCDGVCCDTNPAVSMCCPGLSNPCRAIAAGC
jgi:hypothetical protein